MHTAKTLILTINLALCLPIVASQEPATPAGQQTTIPQGYFAWFKGLFNRQKLTAPTPATVPVPEASKPISPAQNILRKHYQFLTEQLNATTTPLKDLSYAEIRQLELIELDADIANLEQKIEALGNGQIRKKASDLISNLSELVEYWRKYGDKEKHKEDIDTLTLATLVLYQTSISSFLSKVDPVTYRYMQRLGDKVLKQAYFIHHGIAALPLPNQGMWKEVYVLVQNICNANNMPIPKIYYGESKSGFMILPSSTYSIDRPF